MLEADCPICRTIKELPDDLDKATAGDLLRKFVEIISEYQRSKIIDELREEGRLVDAPR